jgi:hypothetical protein
VTFFSFFLTESLESVSSCLRINTFFPQPFQLSSWRFFDRILSSFLISKNHYTGGFFHTIISTVFIYQNFHTIISNVFIYQNIHTIISTVFIYQNSHKIISTVFIYQNSHKIISTVFIYQNQFRVRLRFFHRIIYTFMDSEVL